MVNMNSNTNNGCVDGNNDGVKGGDANKHFILVVLHKTLDPLEFGIHLEADHVLKMCRRIWKFNLQTFNYCLNVKYI